MTNNIVLMHRGDSYYLKYCIKSIQDNCKDSIIHLIGEGVTEEYKGINKYDLNNFNKYSKELEKIYVHKSPSVYHIELFCIKRWFVLLDFMEQNNLDEVMTFDSDVIVKDNLEKDIPFFRKKDFWLAYKMSAGFTYISKRKVLEDYKNLVLNAYKNKRLDADSITDMYFWNKLREFSNYKVGELSDKLINNGIYDCGIRTSQFDLEMFKDMKKIYLINNKAYGKCLKDNAFYEFKLLHFQGDTKFYMNYFLNGFYNPFSLFFINLKLFFRSFLDQRISLKQRDFIKKFMLRWF